jgi:hypothetical protein
MAFNSTTDRALAISIDLSGLVNARINSMTGVQKRERALKEAKFQQIVMDSGLSYDAQIEYRKKQIDDEKTKPSVDLDYITTLESSVRDLRKLNRFKKIREDYLDNYDSLKSGKISLKSHASFLEEQLLSAQSEEERTEIRNELTNVRTQIADSEINTLNNRVLLAQKDGTINVLSSTIDDLNKRKAFADLSGNTEESSAWDVSIISLTKQLNETKVANTINDIDLRINRSNFGAMQKLDLLNSEIQGADANSPITVAGITYPSTRAYWEGKRDSYIAGNGGDGDFSSFFGDFESEVKSKIDTVSSINKFGFVPVITIESISNDYGVIASRPEFVNYEAKINSSRTSALGYGVDKSASALVSSSVESLQLNSGLETLNSLESKFGIDLSSRKSELNAAIISKGSSLPSIKSAAEQLKQVGAETPAEEVPEGTTPKDIFGQNVQPPKIIPATQPQTPVAPITPAAPAVQVKTI